MFPEKYPQNIKTGRLATTITLEGSLFVASLVGLNDLWYSKYSRSKFHLFNDSHEWLQMDKIGHAYTASAISSFCYQSFRWSGVKPNTSLIYGCAVGLGYMTTIEVLDGYSSGWGFSVSDMTANIAGTSFFLAQQLLWQHQYMKLKFSYHPSVYAQYRPEALGDNASQRILKDYNGQTYWLSLGSSIFLPKKANFPRWLCISFGYGADAMLGGFSNPEVNEKGTHLPDYERYRQYYLSLDVDFTMIKTKSKFLRMVFMAVNALKVPFPTLEYNSKGQFKFHYLYF